MNNSPHNVVLQSQRHYILLRGKYQQNQGYVTTCTNRFTCTVHVHCVPLPYLYIRYVAGWGQERSRGSKDSEEVFRDRGRGRADTQGPERFVPVCVCVCVCVCARAHTCVRACVCV